jgi:hypothetical protein
VPAAYPYSVVPGGTGSTAALGAVSLLATFSTSAELLIVARTLLGIARATMAPSTLSLTFQVFTDEQQRATARPRGLEAGRLVGAVAVGHSAADDRPSGSARTRARRPLDEVVHRGRW